MGRIQRKWISKNAEYSRIIATWTERNLLLLRFPLYSQECFYLLSTDVLDTRLDFSCLFSFVYFFIIFQSNIVSNLFQKLDENGILSLLNYREEGTKVRSVGVREHTFIFSKIAKIHLDYEIHFQQLDLSKIITEWRILTGFKPSFSIFEKIKVCSRVLDHDPKFHCQFFWLLVYLPH